MTGQRYEIRFTETAPMATLINDIDEDLAEAPAAPTREKKSGRSSRFASWVRWSLIAVMAVAAIGLWVRGRGYVQWAKQRLGMATGERLAPPLVVGTRPANGSANVRADVPMVIRLKLPNGALDPATLTSANVQLRRPDVDLAVPTKVTAGVAADGVNTLVITPSHPLEGGAKYSVVVTNGVKDVKGVPIVPWTFGFTTGSQADPSIRFAKVALPTAAGFKSGFTCVQFGPDGKLWAGSDDGRIFRFPVEPDGTLGTPTIYASLQKANGGPRLLTGFAFDPTCCDEEIVLWASHGWYGFDGAPDLSGKVSRISGADLSVVQDVVVGLPRSIRDHLTNQPVFGPDGALYIPQASNSSFGAPDEIWGNRAEHRLNASILRLDVSAVTPGQPIDVRTKDVGGTYDPAAPNAPLTIYASGVRLAYDLLWHSNGNLYAPVNGSSANGNAPAGPGVPGLKSIPDSEHDWFHRITPGRYCGHPNPAQGHYILNGGNPTAGEDVAEIPQYPVGTKPDSLWTPPVYDFGNHVSPNGVIEYRSNAFGGKLKGKVLICRYNGGSDILCLDLDAAGGVRTAHVAIPGLTNLTNPLDLTENPATGCIYVSEYGAQKITLLRPVP
jgi:glucose/arabinose dehydrogenase